MSWVWKLWHLKSKFTPLNRCFRTTISKRLYLAYKTTTLSPFVGFQRGNGKQIHPILFFEDTDSHTQAYDLSRLMEGNCH